MSFHDFFKSQMFFLHQNPFEFFTKLSSESRVNTEKCWWVFMMINEKDINKLNKTLFYDTNTHSSHNVFLPVFIFLFFDLFQSWFLPKLNKNLCFHMVKYCMLNNDRNQVKLESKLKSNCMFIYIHIPTSLNILTIEFVVSKLANPTCLSLPPSWLHTSTFSNTLTLPPPPSTFHFKYK